MTRSAPHRWHGDPVHGSRSVVVGVMPGQTGRVVRVAARLATGLGSALVCVWIDSSRTATGVEPDGTVLTTPLDPDRVDDGDEVPGEVELTEALDVQLGSHPGPWRFEYAVGDVAAGLAAAAVEHDAWMIVVGARRPGLAGWMNQMVGGSLAGHLSHTQPVPVVIVPTAVG
ncbi:universal stress protein [Actinotalea sp.]|uniref:universal stress protein n=1 Tax=Actinotalea sp. TaxID=1872145 RepID=UPI003569B398